MDTYRHHVSGFFARREEAKNALSSLVDRGVPREQISIFANDQSPPTPVVQESSNAVLKDVIVNSAIGTAVGTGVGALAEVALVAANVSLFVASPLLAPLVMLGWGASLGGLIGAATGSVSKEGPLSELVTDAIASGQVVLVAETRSKQETEFAREVIQASVGDYNDISTV